MTDLAVIVALILSVGNVALTIDTRATLAQCIKDARK